MTSEDVLKFCDKGNHKYSEVDILKSSTHDNEWYILFKCDVCPSKWVKRI